jgi:hypothetical protein
MTFRQLAGRQAGRVQDQRMHALAAAQPAALAAPAPLPHTPQSSPSRRPSQKHHHC